jgi:chromosomal replication initiator protein DnaA
MPSQTRNLLLLRLPHIRSHQTSAPRFRLSSQRDHNHENPGPRKLNHDHAETLCALWEDCKAAMRESVAPAFLAKFIEPLKIIAAPVGAPQSTLELAAPNAKHKKHIEQRYLPMIRETLRAIPGAPERVLIRTVDESFPLAPQRKAASVLPILGQARHRESFPPGPATDRSETEATGAPGSNGFYLAGHQPAAVNQAELDRLWRGDCGAGALTLTGPSGSGKTAIARAYVRMQSERGVATRYMTAEEFLTEFSLACRKRENISWRQTLRAHRVLVIDDFQFIKPQALRSQEELQYLVDEFQENGQLLILCSDREAAEQGLTPALLSRLSAGYRIQLAYPAHGEREAILSAASQELDLAREHISYLAGRISRDMRQLKSAIRRLTHAREMKGERKSPWTSTQLDQVCADLYTRRPEVAPERVLEVVAEYFQLTPEALRGPIRDKQHSMARHLAAYLCTENLQMNLKETAALIGRREHGSVIHARKKIEESLERDLFLRKQLQELTEKIFAG